MSATGSRLVGALLAASAALSGCTEREIQVRPFRIAATLDGAPAAQGIYEGVATVEDPTTLRLSGEAGELVVTFDPAASPEVVFPASLDGQQAAVLFLVAEGHLGPSGEDLRIPGLQVLALNELGFLEHRFILGESAVARNGLPLLPAVLNPPAENPGAFPAMVVIADNLYFEPAECGLVYYDRLRVIAGTNVDVERDETRTAQSGDPPVQWQVHHVVSWHRTGDCPEHTQTWTQLALWRT